MKRLEMANLFHKDRFILFAGLVVMTIFAWAYMIHMAMTMTETGMAMTKPCHMHWGAGDIVHLFVMWTIMMAAMMLPAAAPMIMMFTTVNVPRSSGAMERVPSFRHGSSSWDTLLSGRHTADWRRWPSGVFISPLCSRITWLSPVPFWAARYCLPPGFSNGRPFGTRACPSAVLPLDS